METRFESLSELLKDPEVAKRLLSCTPEEAASILKEEYQLEFTTEELKDIASGIQAALKEGSTDELSAEQLENVSGGKKSKAYYAGYYIGKSVKVVGTAAGIAGFVITVGW